MADQVSGGKAVQFMQFKADQDGFIKDTIWKTTLGEVYLHRDKDSHTYASLQWMENLMYAEDRGLFGDSGTASDWLTNP